MLPTVAFVIFVSNIVEPYNSESYLLYFGGTLLSLFVFDWRRLTDPARSLRILPFRTVGIGVIASLLPMIVGNPTVPIFFAAAVAMSVALTVQLVAPWYSSPTSVQRDAAMREWPDSDERRIASTDETIPPAQQNAVDALREVLEK